MKQPNLADLQIHALLSLRRKYRVTQTQGLDRMLNAWTAWRNGDEEKCYFHLLMARELAEKLFELGERRDRMKFEVLCNTPLAPDSRRMLVGELP